MRKQNILSRKFSFAILIGFKVLYYYQETLDKNLCGVLVGSAPAGDSLLTVLILWDLSMSCCGSD